MAISEEDKRLAHLAFYEGPSALIEEGYAPGQLRVFFDREDVQFELALLKREYDLNEGFNARAKFMARRQLRRMVEPAMAVVLQSLAGPEYVRDPKTGNVMRDSRGYPLLKNPEVTNGQRWAVEKILDSAGLSDFRIKGDSGIDNNVELLFKKAESPRTIDMKPLGQTPEEQTVARERVRTAIEKLIPRLPAARETFEAEFTEIVRDGRGGRRTATKKRTAKKKATKKKARKVVRRGKAS